MHQAAALPVEEVSRMSRSLHYIRRSGLMFVALLCPFVAALGYAQGPAGETSRQPPLETTKSVALGWNIAVGEKLKYVRSIERRLKISADAPETVITRSLHVTLHAIEQLPDGSVHFREKIDRLCVKKDSPPVDFDSARDEIPLHYQIIVGRIFSFSVDRLGRVSNIKLESEGPELSGQLKQSLSTMEKPDTWKNFIPRLKFPAETVSKGQTWKSESKMEGSPVGDTISTVEHRFLGISRTGDRQIAHIGLTSVFTQEGKLSDAIPMTIKKFTGGGKGEAQFDVARGRLVTWTLDEQTEMEAEAYGKTVTVVSTGTQKWQHMD
jgi:hypothetical protein